MANGCKAIRLFFTRISDNEGEKLILLGDHRLGFDVGSVQFLPELDPACHHRSICHQLCFG